MAASRRRLAAFAAVVLLIGGAVAAWAWHGRVSERPRLGLFTSLPIYWAESGSVGEALEGGGQRHWVRSALEDAYVLVPLDTLDGPEAGPLDRLVMAQPRPLSPPENVALDQWVRKGGRLLLFADPFLTEESRFAIGDKRRPQGAVLLSPILARWGLELTFDDRRSDEIDWVKDGGENLPERLGGRWRLLPSNAGGACTVAAKGLVARCRVGNGSVLAIADAAMLEADRDATPAFKALTKQAFAK